MSGKNRGIGDPLNPDPIDQAARTGKIGMSSHIQPPGAKTAMPQSDKAVLPQSDKAVLPQSDKAVLPQSDKAVLPQSRNTVIRQNDITVLPQNGNEAQTHKRTKTDERVKLTFYVDPEDVRRFDELRYRYNQDHETRLDQNKFMRLIMKQLDLIMLEMEER